MKVGAKVGWRFLMSDANLAATIPACSPAIDQESGFLLLDVLQICAVLLWTSEVKYAEVGRPSRLRYERAFSIMHQRYPGEKSGEQTAEVR